MKRSIGPPGTQVPLRSRQQDIASVASTTPVTSERPRGLGPHRNPPTTNPPTTDECIAASGSPPVMRVTTLKASSGDELGRLLDYYAGLAEDQQRRDGGARGP